MKKRFLFALILVIFVLGITTLILIPTEQPVVPTPTPGIPNTVKTPDELLNTFGEPKKKLEYNKFEIYRYPVKETDDKKHVYVLNNQIVLTREIIDTNDERTKNNFLKQYGTAESIYYGPEEGVGAYLYSYPSKGFAILGNAEVNYIYEIWTFPASDSETFFNKLAQPLEYEKENPELE